MILLRAFLIFCIYFLSLSTALAAPNFPRGCEVRGFSFDGRYLILNETGEQTLYLMQNRANQHIELRRVEHPNVFMSPPLIAHLDPDNWAAFSSDIQALNFECLLPNSLSKGSETTHIANSATPEKPNLKPIDCREALDVCQYPRVKFALSNMGNYWVSTNKSQNQVIHDAAGKGILLRW